LNQKKNGYFYCDLYQDGSRKTCRVSRLVAAAFFGPSHLDVNHKSGMKWDNRPGNLEYATDSQNMQHAYMLGLAKSARGEKHSQARFTQSEIDHIRHLLDQGFSQSEVARLFQTSPGHIWQIAHEKIWKKAA
jgi:HNH endonuclease